MSEALLYEFENFRIYRVNRDGLKIEATKGNLWNKNFTVFKTSETTNWMNEIEANCFYSDMIKVLNGQSEALKVAKETLEKIKTTTYDLKFAAQDMPIDQKLAQASGNKEEHIGKLRTMASKALAKIKELEEKQ